MTGILATIVLVAALVPATLFPIAYHRMAPWRSSEMGRHLMSFTAILAALLWWTLTRRVFGDYPFRIWIGLGLFAVFAALLWHRLYLLYKAQGRRFTKH